jgi:hypothetical protein
LAVSRCAGPALSRPLKRIAPSHLRIGGPSAIRNLGQLMTRTPSRSGFHVVAFRTNPEETVVVPLDAFQLLQVNKAASKDTCLKAYDKLVNTTPDAGYSEVR